MIAAVSALLGRLPRQVYFALGGAIALLLAVLWHNSKVNALEAAAYKRGADDTLRAVDEEQARADRIAAAKAAARQAKQDAVSKEKADDLARTNADIDARAAAARVRHEARRSVRDSAPGDQGGEGEAPRGVEEAPPCDGLPWSVAFPLMVQAEQNQAQLNAILDWEDEQDRIADWPEPLFGQEKP